MKAHSVLFGMTLLAVVVIGAGASGVRDQADPELAAEVEAMLAQSPLREFAGLAPIATEPPSAAAPYRDAPIILKVVEAVYEPLTDLDALYGVNGPPVVQPAPARAQPPSDLVDDTPAMIASAWANPPLDAK